VIPIIKNKGDPPFPIFLIINIYLKITQNFFSKSTKKTVSPLCERVICNEQNCRSTMTNLCITKKSVIDSFSDNAQLDVIYTELEKAFDNINHFLLISKLKSYGISDPLLSWLSYYLINRTQVVNYKKYISDSINVSSGVPQGDHLSLLLLLLLAHFINGLTKYKKFQQLVICR
jgi:hypothetical protein